MYKNFLGFGINVAVIICLIIAYMNYYFLKFRHTGASSVVNINITESKFAVAKGSHLSSNIYQYIDKSGHLVITNKPRVNAQKMKLPPLVVYASPMTANDLYAEGYTADFAKHGSGGLTSTVTINTVTSTPNLHDKGRKMVLLEELNHEKNALDDSLKMWKEAKQRRISTEDAFSYQNRLQALEDNVKEHQKNISLLTRTLN